MIWIMEELYHLWPLDLQLITLSNVPFQISGAEFSHFYHKQTKYDLKSC